MRYVIIRLGTPKHAQVGLVPVLLHGNPNVCHLPEDIRTYVDIVSHLKTEDHLFLPKLRSVTFDLPKLLSADFLSILTILQHIYTVG